MPVGQAVNANVACVTPMMCAPTEEAGASTAGLEGGNFFGYSLGHYYVFGDHVPGTTDVWEEFIERRGRAGLLPRGRGRRSSEERLGAKVAAGDTTGPAGRHRHARPDPRVPAPLRGGRRRPGDLRACRRARTATSTSWSRIELFGREVLPEFKERDEAHVAGQGQAAGAGHRGGHGPQGATTPRRCPRATRSRPCPGRWSTRRGNEQGKEWLERFADETATGDAGGTFNLLG